MKTFSALVNGIDAEYSWTFDGGDGEGVKIYDVEYSWNQDHEDLIAAKNVPLLVGPGQEVYDPGLKKKQIMGQLYLGK